MADLRPTEMSVTDYISRQAVIDEISRFSGLLHEDAIARLQMAVKRLPSVQPERKKGEWLITSTYPHNVYCSECHKRFAQTHWTVWKDGSLPRSFCPNCGALMEEGDQDV